MLRQMASALMPRTYEEDTPEYPEPVQMSLAQQITIWVIYVIFLAIFAFKPRILGYGRALIALLAAAMIVVIQDLTPGHPQNLTEDVDYDILLYLFGLMVISHYMELTGIIRAPSVLFEWTLTRFGPYALIWALSFVTGIIAMFFTNDMAVFLLTPLVVRLTNREEYKEQLQGSSFIFLMILSTTANIASATSPIGNPQNVLVASISGLSFGMFLRYLAIATLICWVANTAFLCGWFYMLQRKRQKEKAKLVPTDTSLIFTDDSSDHVLIDSSPDCSLPADAQPRGSTSIRASMEDYDGLTWRSADDAAASQPLLGDNATTTEDTLIERPLLYNKDPEIGLIDSEDALLPANFTTSDELSKALAAAENDKASERSLIKDAAAVASPITPAEPHTPMHPTVLNILTIASMAIFVLWIVTVSIYQVYLGWATVLAALLVMTVHSISLVLCKIPRQIDPEELVFRQPHVVDYALLFMFHGNFVLIGALLDTGWPQWVFDKLLGSVGDALVQLWLVAVFVYAVVLASNILTNVPVILLLAPLIQGLTDPAIGWLLIAFTTTIAGNLTLVGSAANLITDARSRAIGGPELTFMKYLYYGLPSTLFLAFIGMIVIVLSYGWW